MARAGVGRDIMRLVNVYACFPLLLEALRFTTSSLNIYIMDTWSKNMLLRILFQSLVTNVKMESFGQLLRARGLPLRQRFLTLMQIFTVHDFERFAAMASSMDRLGDRPDDLFAYWELLMTIRMGAPEKLAEEIKSIELFPERFGCELAIAPPSTWAAIAEVLAGNQRLLSTRPFFEQTALVSKFIDCPQLWHLIDGECFLGQVGVFERLWLMKHLLQLDSSPNYSEMAGLSLLVRLQQLVVASQYLYIPSSKPEHPIARLVVLHGPYLAGQACGLFQAHEQASSCPGYVNALLEAFTEQLKDPLNGQKMQTGLQMLWERLQDLEPSLASSRALINTLCMMTVAADLKPGRFMPKVRWVLEHRPQANRRDLYMLMVFSMDRNLAAAARLLWQHLARSPEEARALLRLNRDHFGLLAAVAFRHNRPELLETFRLYVREDFRPHDIDSLPKGAIVDIKWVTAMTRRLVRENCIIAGRSGRSRAVYIPKIETHSYAGKALWDLVKLHLVFRIRLPFSFHPDYLQVVFSSGAEDQSSARKRFLETAFSLQFDDGQNPQAHLRSMHLLDLLQLSQELCQDHFPAHKNWRPSDRYTFFKRYAESMKRDMQQPHEWMKTGRVETRVLFYGELVWRDHAYQMGTTPLGHLQDPRLIQRILLEM